jgi:hypothetical protein
VALLAFFSFEAVTSAFARDAAGAISFGTLALGMFLPFRGLFIGLWDVILVANRSMDLVFAENAIGILIGGDRWYLFLDGGQIHPEVPR